MVLKTQERSVEHGAPASLLAAGLAALGIVYGDIGTSPLYAFKIAAETVAGGGTIGTDPAPVLGVLSLIVWSLLIVIALKYVVFVMRADNHGEGGILALLALTRSAVTAAGSQRLLVALGIFGATLLYADGTITPAISVLSAVEGLEVVTPVFTPWIKPLAVVILIGLFAVQYRGTAVIGRWFGPVMLVWFVTIGALGLAAVVKAPAVLAALDPGQALGLLVRDPGLGFLVFGAVFLALTGGEALYADMGHVGRRSIRISWFVMVLPALLLNYAGQAAQMISQPGPVGNPFFRLAPAGWELPLVVLAALATVIASQSLISGVFTLTRQAIHMDLLPRMKIVQTSREGYGQIYLPAVNYGLMLLTLGVTGIFKTSDDMAAAYGIAVSGTMLITTLLLAVAMRRLWHWPIGAVAALTSAFCLIDLCYFASNLTKLPAGGWIPLAGGLAVFWLMRLWERGSRYVGSRLAELTRSITDFRADLAAESTFRSPGLGVFLTRTAADVPEILVHHIRHVGALPETVIILSIVWCQVPKVPSQGRLTAEPLGNGLWRVEARYGFMQTPNIPVVARRCADIIGIDLNPAEFCYYIGRERAVPRAENPALNGVSEALFAFMARNAVYPGDFYRIPADQVVEIGIQIDI